MKTISVNFMELLKIMEKNGTKSLGFSYLDKSFESLSDFFKWLGVLYDNKIAFKLNSYIEKGHKLFYIAVEEILNFTTNDEIPTFYRLSRELENGVPIFEKHEGWFVEGDNYEYTLCEESEFTKAFEEFKNENYFALVENQAEDKSEIKWFFATLEVAEKMERSYSFYAIKYKGVYKEVCKIIEENKIYADIEFM